MIYMIGGAPRAGKTILAQQVSEKLKIGWISTDVLHELLRLSIPGEADPEWNAAPEAVTAMAGWFYPYLERFIWGISSMADHYVIEGVNFLPSQVEQLSVKYPIRPLFLGCSQMTLERFDRFPGRSKGYAGLPEKMRRQIVQDVPLWSEFIRREAARFGCPYIDMGKEFTSRLDEAEAVLMAGAGRQVYRV